MKILFKYLLIFIISLSKQKENKKKENIKENNKEIKYKKERLIASNFTINPNNEYYYEFKLESMNFSPHDIFPAIYTINVDSVKDNQYYFAKVHYSDAVNSFIILCNK
jgi:hypothetical protein